MIIRISTITLLQLMGIIPTKGPCKKCKDSVGEKVKSTTSNQMYWCSHCASKTYICQNNVLGILNLCFERFFMLVHSYSEIKKSPTDHYRIEVSVS